MTESREEKIRQVVSRRQPDLTVILENVHDKHNIGAVLRTCDAVGIFEIFILHTTSQFSYSHLALGKRTSAGTKRWVDTHYFFDRAACFAAVRKKCSRILGTCLIESATSLFDLNLSEPVAFVFGNEHEGITAETLQYCDGNFVIPQVGMATSLNISVACAVTLYEAMRQRRNKGLYDGNHSPAGEESENLFQLYTEKNEHKISFKRYSKRNGNQPFNL